jgi:hypothetical protein
MIIKPVLKRLCNAWLGPRIILREERYFSNPALIPLALDDPDPDFIFGLTGNSVPAKPAAPDMVLPARSINSAAVRLNQRGKRFLNAVVPATKSSLPRQALHLRLASDSQGGGEELG